MAYQAVCFQLLIVNLARKLGMKIVNLVCAARRVQGAMVSYYRRVTCVVLVGSWYSVAFTVCAFI